MEEIIKELESHLENLRNQEHADVCAFINNEVLKDDSEYYRELTEVEREKMIAQCEERVRIDNYDRSYIIHLLSSFIDYLCLEEHQVFLEFDKLAEIFKYINLNTTSQIKVLLNIIRANHKLDVNSDEPTFVPNVNALMEYEYKYMDKDELRTVFSEHRFEAFLDDETYENRRGRDEVEKRYEETKLDFTVRQRASNTLDDILNRDWKELTEEDYQTIIKNMNEIFFNHLAYRLVKLLKKQKKLANDNEENAKKLGVDTRETSSNTESKPVIKQRKLNQVYYEIGKLYDLENFKTKMPLSLNEIIYLLSLMYSINMESKVIDKFLGSVMHQYFKGNPFVIYYESYDKFVKMSSNSDIKGHLDMIEYLLSDFAIFMCTSDKYAEIKEMVEEEIKAIGDIIGNDYTYEKTCAKKQLI
ncbi:MAG: hypothetical protein OSJ70_06725 [Bacilli bacterium]|nr:hypothetical protein [Bacilli bacterium]